MLRWRLVAGISLVLVFGLLVALDLKLGPGAPVLLLLASVVVARASWEFCELARPRVPDGDWRALAAWGLLLTWSNWWPRWFPSLPAPHVGWPLLVFCLAVCGFFLQAMARYRAPGGNIEWLALHLLGLAYCAGLTTCVVQLRWVAGGALGYVPLVSLVVATKCGDTLAYTLGRLIGGAKMSPLLSPGKTLAGGAGALLGGMLGTWAWLNGAIPRLAVAEAAREAAQSPLHEGVAQLANLAVGPVWAVLLFGLLLGLFGLFGDLAESLIKRDLGQKDAPPLFRGLGGALDVIDSVLFCGPIALLLWSILPLVRGLSGTPAP